MKTGSHDGRALESGVRRIGEQQRLVERREVVPYEKTCSGTLPGGVDRKLPRIMKTPRG